MCFGAIGDLITDAGTEPESPAVAKFGFELAGEAANGAVAHVGLTADAPQQTVKDFDRKFQAEYRYKGDHNAVMGYRGMYIVKVMSERIG